MFNNYRQCLLIQSTHPKHVESVLYELELSPDAYEKFFIEESNYLGSLKDEPQELLTQMEYVRALKNLDSKASAEATALANFRARDQQIIFGGLTRKGLSALTRRLTIAGKDHDLARLRVEALESALHISIEDRWKIGRAHV